MIYVDDEYLDSLEAVAKAASPGEWAAYDGGPDGSYVRIHDDSKPFPKDLVSGISYEDAELIAASKSEIPELIELIRRLVDRMDRLEMEKDDAINAHLVAEREIDSLEKDIDSLSERIQELQGEIEDARRDEYHKGYDDGHDDGWDNGYEDGRADASDD